MINKLHRITFLVSNRLKFSEISYSTTLAKTSSDRFRVYLSPLALLVELICKGVYDYHYYHHSNHYHHQHCCYHNQQKRKYYVYLLRVSTKRMYVHLYLENLTISDFSKPQIFCSLKTFKFVTSSYLNLFNSLGKIISS